MSEETAQNEVDRRTFLSYIIAAIGGFITAIIGVPVIGSFILPTLRPPQTNLVSAGSISSFAVGEPKAATVTIKVADGWIEDRQEKGIWVVKRSDTDFTVYNGRCVHLGCAYNWAPAQKEFACPCHAGRYSVDGVVLGGPPPRPLDTLDWKVDQGNLMVEYKDFRLGIPQKEAV